MLTSLQNIWNGLAPARRAMLVGVLALVFLGILAVAQLTSRPVYGVLYSNMEPEDAGAVTGKLREMKVDYRLAQEGRTIEVPQDRVHELRLSMATEGLPRGGTVGFEVFDRANFGATDFTQRLNYQRALQGELMRTIGRLEGVLDARVHLALPERRLFTEQDDPITASVVLHLRPGYQPDDRAVAGLVHLVSSAVEGLKPESVTVHDDRGNLLSRTGTEAGPSQDQVDLAERYERRLESELRQLANEVLGPGKAAIRVSAELTWDQTETTSEVYRPSGADGRNLPLTERNTLERYARSPGGARGPAGLAAGLSSAAPGSDPGQYTNSTGDFTYAVNKTVERKVTPPGRIRRLSIAVLLDQAVGAGQQEALKNAFAAAAGLDLDPVSAGGRGDRIELLPMPFDRTAETQAARAAEVAAREGSRLAMVRNGAAVGVVVLLVIGSLVMLRRLQSVRPAPFEAIITEDTSLPAPYTPLKGEPGSLTEPQPAVLSPVDRLRRLAADRPEEVARQLQLWMAE